MKKHVCGICGYDYNKFMNDPTRNFKIGISFYKLPEALHCPVCGSLKGESIKSF